MNRIGTVILALGLLVVAGACSKRDRSSGEGNGNGPDGAPEQTGPPVKATNGIGTFTISKETTYVTGPLDKNGRIDYTAALDERLRKDITPAKNANVAFWQAIGPDTGKHGVTATYLDKLGVGKMPATGDYYIPMQRFIAVNLKMSPGSIASMRDKLALLAHQPWTAQQHADIHAYLTANEKPLKLVFEGTTRPQFYSPVIPNEAFIGPSGLLSSPLPGAQLYREIASALAARAMLNAGHGQVDAAWADLLAGHRLARLVARGATLTEGVLGTAIEIAACRADIVFLDHCKPDSKRLDGYLRDLWALAPMPAVVDKFTLAERYGYLDHMMQLDRRGSDYMRGLNEALVGDVPPSTIQNLYAGADWDPALRDGNGWFDRQAAALRLADRTQRNREFDKIAGELAAVWKASKGRVKEMASLGKDAGRAKGELVSLALITVVMPQVRKVQDAADRGAQTFDIVVVAFALARYQRDHGRYPDRLEALAPKYVGEAPRDRFTGGALVYRPAANGFLLYSVGENGQDGGGRGYDDEPKGDDLVVRIPVVPPK